jgi:hypothetical protein
MTKFSQFFLIFTTLSVIQGYYITKVDGFICISAKFHDMMTWKYFCYKAPNIYGHKIHVKHAYTVAQKLLESGEQILCLAD